MINKVVDYYLSFLHESIAYLDIVGVLLLHIVLYLYYISFCVEPEQGDFDFGLKLTVSSSRFVRNTHTSKYNGLCMTSTTVIFPHKTSHPSLKLSHNNNELYKRVSSLYSLRAFV